MVGWRRKDNMTVIPKVNHYNNSKPEVRWGSKDNMTVIPKLNHYNNSKPEVRWGSKDNMTVIPKVNHYNNSKPEVRWGRKDNMTVIPKVNHYNNSKPEVRWGRKDNMTVIPKVLPEAGSSGGLLSWSPSCPCPGLISKPFIYLIILMFLRVRFVLCPEATLHWYPLQTLPAASLATLGVVHEGSPYPCPFETSHWRSVTRQPCWYPPCLDPLRCTHSQWYQVSWPGCMYTMLHDKVGRR